MCGAGHVWVLRLPNQLLCAGRFTRPLSHPRTLACFIDVLETGEPCQDSVCQPQAMPSWVCAAAELQVLLQHSVKCHPT